MLAVSRRSQRGEAGMYRIPVVLVLRRPLVCDRRSVELKIAKRDQEDKSFAWSERRLGGLLQILLPSNRMV